jgi:hypothetical protein
MKHLLLSLLFIASTSQAGELLIHAGSLHGNKRYDVEGGAGTYNNFNPGIGYRFDSGVVTGAYYNSYRTTTVYAGYIKMWKTGIGSLEVGGLGVVATGYQVQTGHAIQPLGSLAVSVTMGDVKPYLLFMPKVSSDTVSVLHLMVGKPF